MTATFPAWKQIECWTCGGFGVVDRSYHDPDECRTCGGSGHVWKHIASGVLSQWPGGPLLGREWPDIVPHMDAKP